MRSFSRALLVGSILVINTAFAGLYYLGLDDDGTDSIDNTLETYQVDEEIGFAQVAAVIRAFVIKQFSVRNDPENTEKFLKELRSHTAGKYSNVYLDLPNSSPYATRDVHRKTHGCFRAQLNVESNLMSAFNDVTGLIQKQRKYDNAQIYYGPMPEQLKNESELGVLQPGQTIDAIVRFSNGHPMNRHDKLPDARGFAVKLLSPGAVKVSQSLSDLNAEDINAKTALDILSINFPTFFVNEKETSVKYTEINQLFLSGAVDFTSELEGKLKEGLSIFTSGIDALEIRKALWVNGSIIQNPLFQEYFSMVPSRLGPLGSQRAVKYYWTPIACDKNEVGFTYLKDLNWPDWSNERHFADPVNPVSKRFLPPYNKNLVSDYPHDYLRKNLEARLRKNDFCYALYLQPYRDQLSTNIEDSNDLWLRNEDDRINWKNNVVPSKYNPLWHAYGNSREEYLEKLAAKKIVKPVKAAVLRISQLKNDEFAKNTMFCENLSFNPWNGNREYHKPLGIISRLKRRVYNASRKTRYMLNKVENLNQERR